MINYTNNSQVYKMREVPANTFDSTVSMFYIDGEETIACYQAVRDYMIFTNKRMIVVDVQGITGKKKD
ncbi:MAG: PH domain-containing protein, partial [Anaerolineaceae bacterium]|nr:PH domain-containing protein [Anaerolineaceae bacterium]